MGESKKNFIGLFLIVFVLVMLSYIQIYKIYGGKNSPNDYIVGFNEICNSKYKDIVDYCDIDITGLPGTPDTYTIFFNIIRSDILYHLPIFGLLLIIVFSLNFVNKLFKSKYLYYYVQRKEYKLFLKKMIINSYKYVLVIPFMMALIYLLSLTISTHGQNALTIAMRAETFDSIAYNTPGFLVLYTINIMLKWLFFINLGLIMLSKNRKFIFTIIEVYIIYFVLEIIFELLPQYFWIFDFYNPMTYSIYIYILVSLIQFIISFIIVILIYKNKEKILSRIGA
ncbi:MAG: hypothetical protein J5982_06115 [Bacilli bacterium]|nr:hypothetical protein [Bacilli bacterium]